MRLDSPRSVMDNKFVLFGYVGYDAVHTAFFFALARLLKPGPQYFVSSAASLPPVSFRLPCRFGFEESTVHTAKSPAMIASLRWCTPGARHMVVSDRSSLFAALRETADSASLWPFSGACLPLKRTPPCYFTTHVQLMVWCVLYPRVT